MAAVEFAPLQLAPAVATRGCTGAGAHAVAGAAPGPGMAAVVLVRRAGADRRRRSSRRSRTFSDELFRGAHGRAPADRRPRRAAAGARPDRPAARSPCCASASCAGCACSRIRSSRFRCGRSNFYVWHLPALYQGAVEQRRRARAPAPDVRRPAGWRCGWRCSARCPSPPGSATARSRLHRRRAADPVRAGQRAAVVGRRALSALRGGRALLEHLARSPTRARRARS